MKVVIRRKLINEFRKQCRLAYPNETMAVLRGIRRVSEVEILSIEAIPHQGEPKQIKYETRHIYKSKLRALRKETDWLGTIHSHCSSEHIDTCSHPSDTDQRGAVEHGETIMGIVYVYGVTGCLRTDVNWYTPTAPPDVELKGENA